MFGKAKIQELETQLTTVKQKLDTALKEKTDLDAQLKSAKNRIGELEQKLADTDLTQLKEEARKTIVEYEGLKELYQKKNQELDASREDLEEGFAREAATKRSDLADEIRANREDNQAMVSETVQTFAGSYQYYLDQVRTLMDALSQAARETGESLFDGDTQSIKERFGARILEHLRLDKDSLQQDTGDLLLIGKEEAPAAEEVIEEAAETLEEAAEEAMEAAEEVADEAKETVEEAVEAIEDVAEEIADEVAEEFEGAEEAAEEFEEAEEEAEEFEEAEEVEAEEFEEAEEVEEVAEEASEAIDEVFSE